MLQGVQKRLFDIASTLGLSNTVMRLIEKRGTQVCVFPNDLLFFIRSLSFFANRFSVWLIVSSVHFHFRSTHSTVLRTIL